MAETNTPPNDQLQAILDRLDAQDKTIELLQSENEAYKTQLQKADQPAEAEPEPTIPTKSFKVDGIEWKFLVPVFNYNGNRITAQDALSDKKVLEYLVERKSELIQQVA